MLQSRRRITHAPPSGDGKTEQHHAPTADINAIVNRHKPGQFIGDPRATRQPMFIDVPSETFHESLNRVCDVQNKFATLPSRIRGMFHNDPFQMLRFVENPENRQKALKLGLVIPNEDELQILAQEAAKARRGEQIDIIREANKPDPEAQPDYSERIKRSRQWAEKHSEKPKSPEGD